MKGDISPKRASSPNRASSPPYEQPFKKKIYHNLWI